jgi:hypothetical protein
MSTSQRVSRGFHRLALFLAAIPLLVGGLLSVYVAYPVVSHGLDQHQRLVCAHEHLDLAPAAHAPKGTLSDEDIGLPLSLKEVGCSDNGNETVSYEEARNPPDFNWLTVLGLAMVPLMSITLILTLAVYALVRAIGWVIGGFTAS